MSETTPHRSFTVRIPTDLYCEIGEGARKEGVSINHKVGQFIRLGMDKEVDLNTRLLNLIREDIVPKLERERSACSA